MMPLPSFSLLLKIIFIEREREREREREVTEVNKVEFNQEFVEKVNNRKIRSRNKQKVRMKTKNVKKKKIEMKKKNVKYKKILNPPKIK